MLLVFIACSLIAAALGVLAILWAAAWLEDEPLSSQLNAVGRWARYADANDAGLVVFITLVCLVPASIFGLLVLPAGLLYAGGVWVIKSLQKLNK